MKTWPHHTESALAHDLGKVQATRAEACQGSARSEFERSGLVLLGTLRKNGWPRISPVEAYITDGHLYLGMMWQSRKALDLLRDPRCTVHSVVSKPDGSEGEFKVYGRGGRHSRSRDAQDALLMRSMRG